MGLHPRERVTGREEPAKDQADENLGRIFGGQDQVTLLELAQDRSIDTCPPVRKAKRHTGRGAWEGVRGTGAGVGVRDAGMLAGDVRRGTETENTGNYVRRIARTGWLARRFPLESSSWPRKGSRRFAAAYAVVVTSRS